MRSKRRVGIVTVIVVALGVLAPAAQALVSPGVPTEVTATGADGAVDLAWQAPPDNGVPIFGYKVYVSGPDGNETISTGSSSTTFRHENLTNGEEYTYRVAAVNVLMNEGGASESVSATPFGAPSEPTNLRANAFWTGQKIQVTLAWDPPVDLGGSPILGYRVSRDSEDAPIAELGGETLQFSERIFAEGATYSVTAFNAAGESGAANINITRNPNYFNGVDVTLRDAGGDVVRSDAGGSTYSGNGDFSRILDGSYVNRYSGIQDVLVFDPWGKRSFVVQHAAINDGQPLDCDDNFSRVQVFSRQNQDWFTTLKGSANGTSVVGDAGIRCWTKGSGADYFFDFPNYIDTPNAGQECGVITKVDASTYSFEAPASCLADIYEITFSKGSSSSTVIGDDVAAPFKLTATLG